MLSNSSFGLVPFIVSLVYQLPTLQPKMLSKHLFFSQKWVHYLDSVFKKKTADVQSISENIYLAHMLNCYFVTPNYFCISD